MCGQWPHHSGLAAGLQWELLGEPEVHDFDVTLGRQHDVEGLQVAMHYLFLVRRFHRFGNLHPELQQLG